MNLVIIKPLSHQAAYKQARRIAELMNEIPGFTSGSPEEVLREDYDGKKLTAKWQHSLAMYDNEAQIIGIAIGWERGNDKLENYPLRSVHIGFLVIDKNRRNEGLGKRLLGEFLRREIKRGKYIKLDNSNLAFSLVTNSASYNKPIQNLYRSFGFKTAAKTFNEQTNHTDYIMIASPYSVTKAASYQAFLKD